jgi:GNAT superfamily N-acetyltransferase
VCYGDDPAATADGWANVIGADESMTMPEAHERFQREFQWLRNETRRRMLFALDEMGRPVGTATAWFEPHTDATSTTPIGRLHFVSLRPKVRGRGLAKPLVYAALKRLKDVHGKDVHGRDSTIVLNVNSM